MMPCVAPMRGSASGRGASNDQEIHHDTSELTLETVWNNSTAALRLENMRYAEWEFGKFLGDQLISLSEFEFRKFHPVARALAEEVAALRLKNMRYAEWKFRKFLGDQLISLSEFEFRQFHPVARPPTEFDQCTLDMPPPAEIFRRGSEDKDSELCESKQDSSGRLLPQEKFSHGNAGEMTFAPSSICESSGNVRTAKEKLQGIWKEINSKESKLPLAQPIKPREDLENGFKQEYTTSGGERIHICDCELDLPENCFKEQTNVSVTVEVDSSKWPDGYIGITPMIHVSSERKFEKPATVNLTTWCTSDGSELSKHQTVHVLHKPNDGDEWEVLCQLPLAPKRDQCSLKFECMDFSPVFVGILENECGNNEEYTITGIVHQRDKCLEMIFFNEDMFTVQDIEKKYEITGKRKLFDPIDVRIEDEIKVIVENNCEKEFPLPEPVVFTVHKTFVRTPRKVFYIKMQVAEADVKLRFQKNEDNLPNDVLFSYDRRISQYADLMRSVDAKDKSYNITFHFHENEVSNTAGTMICDNATANIEKKDCPEVVSSGPQDSKRSSKNLPPYHPSQRVNASSSPLEVDGSNLLPSGETSTLQDDLEVLDGRFEGGSAEIDQQSVD